MAIKNVRKVNADRSENGKRQSESKRDVKQKINAKCGNLQTRRQCGGKNNKIKRETESEIKIKLI